MRGLTMSSVLEHEHRAMAAKRADEMMVSVCQHIFGFLKVHLIDGDLTKDCMGQ